jgi:hypothetical protein
MRLAYADPPYPGNAHLYRDHPDYAGEVDHAALIASRAAYDGWALSTSAGALQDVLALCPPKVRVIAWVTHRIGNAWEPVIVKAGRPAKGVRDWLRCEPDAYQYRPKPESYVIGQKPEPFCRWVFGWLGAQTGDTLADLYPGSGAVARAWARYIEQPTLFEPRLPTARDRRRWRTNFEPPRNSGEGAAVNGLTPLEESRSV